MSRQARAALEAAQTRLREVRAALELPATPGFDDAREALLDELRPQRELVVQAQDQQRLLEKRASGAESALALLQIDQRARRARGDVGVLPFVAAAGSIVAGVLIAAELYEVWQSIEPMQVVVVTAVHAFFMGLLLRLRIVPK